jgi:hypothetical protein
MTMRTCFVLLLVVLVTPVGAATIWDVEYFIRGDISQVHRFYDAGTYELLWTPNYVTTYLMMGDSIGTVFIGMYGAPYGVLPEGFPLIAFPSGYDQALVVPTVQPDTVPSTSVPEPAAWLLMVAGVAVLIAARYRSTFLRGRD